MIKKFSLGMIIMLLAGCNPQVATSFWRIGTAADSTKKGYTIIHAEGKTRHCYPVKEWKADPAIDTYHQMHHHGVAVESDKMAYRIYFDKKQTIDPYCKRVAQLELANSYWYPNDSLLAAHYGDDILRVSGTVGVGSVKYWNRKKHIHIEPVAERSQRIIEQSRKSATIEVAVEDWQVEGKIVDMDVQYTMQGGHRDMRCDVYLSEEVEGLCTGVQMIPNNGKSPRSLDGSHDTIIVVPNGTILASWGTDWPVNDSTKFAKETVGLAVFIPRDYTGAPVRDKRNNLCLLKQAKAKEGYSTHFYLTCVGATKEDHPIASNAREWYAYLRKWAIRLK
jgi:hypothetical protein